jgi:hypothetical protein
VTQSVNDNVMHPPTPTANAADTSPLSPSSNTLLPPATPPIPAPTTAPANLAVPSGMPTTAPSPTQP